MPWPHPSTRVAWRGVDLAAPTWMMRAPFRSRLGQFVQDTVAAAGFADMRPAFVDKGAAASDIQQGQNLAVSASQSFVAALVPKLAF